MRRHWPSILILLAVLGSALHSVLSESYWQALLDSIFDRVFAYLEPYGITRSPVNEAISAYIVPVSIAAISLYAAYRIGVADRSKKSPLEFVYRSNDPRYVETRPGLSPDSPSNSRYYIDVFNRTTDRTVRDVKVTWDETPFTTLLDDEVRRGADYERRNLLHEASSLHPQEGQLFYLFGLDDRIVDSPDRDDVLGHASCFTVRASGTDAAEITAVFEYSPLRFPKLLRVS
jgi:hypothetical protein